MQKCCISVNGRFHFFDLSRQLFLGGRLKSIITTYPKFVSRKWGIPSCNVTSLFYFEVMKRFLVKLRIYNSKTEFYTKKIFGFLVMMTLPKKFDCYIFFAGNGCQSWLVRILNGRGVLTIADEGSAHIKWTYKKMLTEYKRFNIKNHDLPSKKMVNETCREYAFAKKIVVPSSFVKKTFIKNGISPEKIKVVPYGVDLSSFYPAFNTTAKNCFRVIFVGQLSIQKGSHYLLKAMYSLRTFSDIEMWHVGAIKPEMNNFIREFDNPKIKFFGVVDQKRLRDFYIQADLFILPSIQDGFGMVVLQAMACGLPVICSTNSCGPDLFSTKDIHPPGILIKPGSSKAIVDAILKLYWDRTLLFSMAKSAVKSVRGRFSWDDYGGKYITILDEDSAIK